MTQRICDCTYCECVVPDTAPVVNGKSFCCEACASSHPDNQPCQNSKCDCHRRNWGGIKS
ncbi:metallothionein [Kushneria indalinina]|uniref:Metallothionein n=1 Tax=Kushneria indalinina DSM 14324 TaxID=1122140 RepID=A0A3D9DYB0_9GAMM|nr:metallothionein [Kushneria indalinina]REC95758.1 metallothionein [Kushneria indalinina DSM 14324]